MKASYRNDANYY